MSNLVGRVHFTSTLDGKNMPREAEKIGAKSGKAAADGYDKTWSKGFQDSLTKEAKGAVTRMRNSGGEAGTAFGRAVKDRLDVYLRDAQKSFDNLRIDPDFLDSFAAGFDDAGLAAGALQQQLKTLADQGDITSREFEVQKKRVSEWAEAQRQAAADSDAYAGRLGDLNTELRRHSNELAITAAETERNRASMDAWGRDMSAHLNVLDQWGDAQRKIAQFTREDVDAKRELSHATGALDAAFRKLNKDVEEQTFHWKNLSHNTRQWTLIIGAVAAGMQDLAVLGSAAGGGLIALGGAASSAVLGVGGLVAVIATLNDDLDDLPASLRGVAREAEGFSDVFITLRNVIAQGAFREMSGVFSQFEANLKGLAPELELLGKSVGTLFRELAANTKPGTEAFKELQTLVRQAGPNFESLTRSTGTFGVAFVRAFNRAQPLVEDLTGWIDRLANQFDEFTQGSGFDEWMSNAQRTFESLGPLLDATGRALNDLVTPESVTRTKAFLDNLTEFMPNLGKMLDILGRVDVFGLLAQALNDVGQALEPLAAPAADLADAVAKISSIFIGEFADALSAVAILIAPAAQALADFMNALDPGAIELLSGAVIFLGGAFLGIRHVTNAITAIAGFQAAAAAATTGVDRFGNSVKANMGKAGLLAQATVGVVALGAAIGQLVKDMSGYEARGKEAAASTKNLAQSVDSILVPLNYMGQEIEGTSLSAKNLDDAMRLLANSGGTQWGVAMNNAAGATSEAKNAASDLASALQTMDQPLADLANANLPAAQERFRQLTEGMNLTDGQMINLINGSFPELRKALENASLATGSLATEQDILALATGDVATETANSVDPLKASADAMAILQGKAFDATGAIGELADKIRTFGDQTLSTRDAQRQFEEAIDQLTGSVQDNGAALNQQGTDFDISTEAGRKNQEALDRVVQATKESAAAALEQSGDIDQATAAINRGRDALILQLEQLGFTEEAAKQYVDQLNLVPVDIQTIIEIQGIDAALEQAKKLRDAIYSIPTKRSIDVSVKGGWNPTVDRPMARGGVLTGPTHVLAGEAGREAFVPLDRPLSQVDESVRWLAAIAQGKTGSARMAGGGVTGAAGRQVVFSEGAIVVQDFSGDSRRTANEVMERVAESVAG